MITSDYSRKLINPDELQDLIGIADIGISDITLDEYPSLLVFPDSFASYDRDFGRKVICHIEKDSNVLCTNSIIGFIGRNDTHLSIHSRFCEGETDDYFVHYMLQRVAKINLFNMRHTLNEDSVFDFLIYMFPQCLKNAVSRGVYRRYVFKNYNDAKMKGVVDVKRHIRQNEPFFGNVSYTTREFSCDNDVTQLIRHTIEYIRRYKEGDILTGDADTRMVVAQIVDATPSYVANERMDVINKNLRPVVHPFYREYTQLQRLCLQILRHEELKYGQRDNEIYGVLIDAAWLWEEYLAVLLEGHYNHYTKDTGKRFWLFEDGQQIIPDYLSVDGKIVADAKYIPLDKEQWYSEEKALALYYKTITYMYRFCTHKGYLFYPHSDKDINIFQLKIKTECEGVNGGMIIKMGLKIPKGYDSYATFCSRMNQYEMEFLNELE